MKRRYIPNRIEPVRRRLLAASSSFIATYGAWSIWRNDFAVPIWLRSRNGAPWLHLHDGAAIAASAALFCACLVMLSVVLDHYDKRDNERHYKLFAQVFTYAGWTFVMASLLAWWSTAS